MCLKKGCPRTKVVEREKLEDWIPKNVVEIRNYCPWHYGHCDKGYPEFYYDSRGRQIDWETGKPVRENAEIVGLRKNQPALGRRIKEKRK